MNLTPEQQLAVDLEGTNIIVSAGAGSGKTAVLSERVIRKLKDGIDIRNILMLTFTNEAAGEMANRIRKKIKKAGLTSQLEFLDQAYITTFDAFALSLVKKYHYVLNIDKSIDIIDSSIIDLKRNEFLEEIFLSLYDAKDEKTKEFFKTVQNKMHYAVHGNTAAEVIFNRVDSEKENIGLTNFKGNMPTKFETEIAKNYLSEKEMDMLNRMVSAYLDVAEINALNMHPMTMKDWIKELDGFLTMTHKEILEGVGKISHEKALKKAHEEYDKYMKSHLTQAEKDYLEIMGEDIKKLK